MFFIKIHIRMHNFKRQVPYVPKIRASNWIYDENNVVFDRKCPIMDRPISLRKLTKVIILEFPKNFGHLDLILAFFVQKFQKSDNFLLKS